MSTTFFNFYLGPTCTTHGKFAESRKIQIMLLWTVMDLDVPQFVHQERTTRSLAKSYEIDTKILLQLKFQWSSRDNFRSFRLDYNIIFVLS